MTKYHKDTPSATDILDTALEMADEGIPVFPVGFRKTPVWSNKMLGLERGQGGLKVATTDHDRLEYLFTDPMVAHRVTGIGVPTGRITKMTVVDVDCGEGKENADSAIAWLDEHRSALRGAKAIRTQSGGLQYYCRYTPEIPSAGNVWAPGVDCRNDGGFVVVPPYMGYSVARHIDPDDWPSPPPIPEALKKGRQKSDAEYHGGEVPEEVQTLIKIMNAAKGDDDGWHTAAVRLTAHLVGAGWSDAEILRYAVQWTKGGYTHRETFEDLTVMVAGARAKWTRKVEADARNRAAVEDIKVIVPRLTLEQLRDLLPEVEKLIRNGEKAQ